MNKIKQIIENFLGQNDFEILFFLKDFIHHLSHGSAIEIPSNLLKSLNSNDLKSLYSCLSLIQENNKGYELLNFLNSSIYQSTKTKDEKVINRANEVLIKFNKLNKTTVNSIYLKSFNWRIKSRQRRIRKIIGRKGRSTNKSTIATAISARLNYTSSNVVVRHIKLKNGISIQILMDSKLNSSLDNQGIITPEILKNIESNLE
jgi:hypothetical protein